MKTDISIPLYPPDPLSRIAQTSGASPCKPPAYPDDPVKDALAWYILDDQSDVPGTLEQENEHWNSCRRLGKQFFSCVEELNYRANMHVLRKRTRQDQWTPDMDVLPSVASAHQKIETLERIELWKDVFNTPQ